MLLSYEWLKKYVDLTDVTPTKLAELLTKGGIEVEGVNGLADGITNVVVGHVLERIQHPNAEKLSVCQVDVGEEEPVQIVCGAKNVRAGLKVVVAKVGAVLPGDFKIKKAKLRGEASNGMICSLSELGLESKVIPKEFAEGIVELPLDAPVGMSAMEYLGLADTVLELGLTPNRSDCLSLIGSAYEVAALLNRDVQLPTADVVESGDDIANYIAINVEATEQNPLYAARLVKNVKIGPSPLWLQGHLIASGIRPHNNVVDITNFILLEFGQPLHAFDYDRLGSKEIVVRLANDGEKFTTLDDQERTLQSHQLVITNGQEPVALAGVMGGANSEVIDTTVNVLIEAAYFEGQSVRQTVKDHGLRSESSTRFEKGVDRTRTVAALNRAAQLMVELAGGEVVTGIAKVETAAPAAKEVSVELSRINAVLGMNIPSETVADIFRRLAFDLKVEGETFTVVAPSHRRDINISEDLIEEVARVYGYDDIPATLPVQATTPGRLTTYQAKRRTTRRFLEGAGLFQAITYSLTSGEKAQKFALTNAEPVRLAMPMSEERSTLRLSLLPHLLEVASYNRARQIDRTFVYETASIFLPVEGQELPAEREHLAGVFTGMWHDHLWQGEKKAVDFFVAKGVLEGLFDKLGVDVQFVQAVRDDLHPGRTANLVYNGDVIGYIGQLHPTTQKDYSLKETYVFELELYRLLQDDVTLVSYEPIPRFPSITRDIALVVDQTVPASQIANVIKQAGGRFLKDVTVFDLYEGDKLEAGKKSLAFSMKYFDAEKTLTDEEVVAAHNKVLKAVEAETGAVLRA